VAVFTKHSHREATTHHLNDESDVLSLYGENNAPSVLEDDVVEAYNTRCKGASSFQNSLTEVSYVLVSICPLVNGGVSDPPSLLTTRVPPREEWAY
jgi:hypothetical protein